MAPAGHFVARPRRPKGSPGLGARRARYQALCPTPHSELLDAHATETFAAAESLAKQCNDLHDALGRILDGRAAQKSYLRDMLDLLASSSTTYPGALDPELHAPSSSSASLNVEETSCAELDASAVEHFDMTICDISEDDLEASYDELDAPWCMSSNAEDESVAEGTPTRDDAVDTQLPSIACCAAQELNYKPIENGCDTSGSINSLISTLAESELGALSATSFASSSAADWSVLSQDSASNLSFLGAINADMEACNLVSVGGDDIAVSRNQEPSVGAVKPTASLALHGSHSCEATKTAARRPLQLRQRAILQAATPARSVVLAFKPRS